MCFRSNIDLPHEPKIFDLRKLCLINMGKINQNEINVFWMAKKALIDN